MKKPHDLMDHIQVGFWSIPCYIYRAFVHQLLTIQLLLLQLYLLGLPNKLGPLGFLALHHVLTTDEVDTAATSKVGEM